MNFPLDYLKNILKVLFWPILFGIGQFVIIMVFTLLFNVGLSMDPKELYDYMGTVKYQTELAQFFSNHKLLITLILASIFLPIFIKVYKKNVVKIKTKLMLKDYVTFSLLGISICFIFNIIIVYINNIFNITNLYSASTIQSNILITILCTGIIGPIIEEYLFRGIVYNKLKLFISKSRAIILTSLIFAFMHNNFIHTIYAFFISLVLIYVYEKYKTIKAPIVIHIFANTTIILTLNFIVNSSFVINGIILLIMTILFIMTCREIKLKDNTIEK